jgi:surface carbohydrate biosynthesis protein
MAQSAPMNVALVVDSPKRDLDGVLLVAYQLALQGADAYIVPMYQQGYDVPLLRPDAVLANYARENNRELLAAYRALGICVAVLDTEGGVLSESGSDSPASWARAVQASGLGSCIDEYFFWGEKLHAAFVRDSGLAQDALHVTGCPRYDFCFAPWRSTLRFASQGYVLVNTNFSAINPAFTRSKEVEKAIFVQLGWAPGYVDRLFEDLESVFPRYLDVIERLARAVPSLAMRIRPHPFEDQALYVRRFAGLKNVTVDGSGNVLPAIAHAACVVHLNCGTAVESLMLGTPAISLEYLNTETMRAHAPLPTAISLPAASFEELVELARDPVAARGHLEDMRPSLLERHVRPWFGPMDGHAAQRVAERSIAAAAERPRPRRSLTRSLTGGRAASVGRLLAGAASNLMGSRAVALLQEMRAPERCAKAISVADVRTRMERIRAVEQVAPPIKVESARHPLSGLPLASILVSAR